MGGMKLLLVILTISHLLSFSFSHSLSLSLFFYLSGPLKGGRGGRETGKLPLPPPGLSTAFSRIYTHTKIMILLTSISIRFSVRCHTKD